MAQENLYRAHILKCVKLPKNYKKYGFLQLYYNNNDTGIEHLYDIYGINAIKFAAKNINSSVYPVPLGATTFTTPNQKGPDGKDSMMLLSNNGKIILICENKSNYTQDIPLSKINIPKIAIRFCPNYYGSTVTDNPLKSYIAINFYTNCITNFILTSNIPQLFYSESSKPRIKLSSFVGNTTCVLPKNSSFSYSDSSLHKVFNGSNTIFMHNGYNIDLPPSSDTLKSTFYYEGSIYDWIRNISICSNRWSYYYHREDSEYKYFDWNMIYLNSNITFIGDNNVNFEGQSAYDVSLSHVNLPSDISSIKIASLRNATWLQEITLNNLSMTFGLDCFWGCSNLKRVNYIGTLSQWLNNTTIKNSIGTSGYTYSNTCFGSPLWYGASLYVNGNKITSVTLPHDVSILNPGIFAGLKDLVDIDLGSITKISYFSLAKTGLTNLTIPDTIAEIQTYALLNCNITEFTYLGNQDGWVSIKKGSVMSNVNNHLKINDVIVTKLTTDIATSVEQYSFYKNTELTEIELSDNTTFIGKSAFEGCVNLTLVNFGNTAVSLEINSFRNCNNLTSLVLPDNSYCKGDYVWEPNAALAKTSLKKCVIGSGCTFGFYSFPNTIRTVISLGESVPTMERNGPGYINASVWYIPKGCLSKYQAVNWTIMPLSIIETNIEETIPSSFTEGEYYYIKDIKTLYKYENNTLTTIETF